MQSCYLETYAMVARSLLKKQSATKTVTSRTCTIYVCLRFKFKKNPLMIRPTWIIFQNRSKNTSLLPLRTLQPLSRGMLSSTEKHTYIVRRATRGSNKARDICTMFEKVKGDNMNCSLKKICKCLWYIPVSRSIFVWILSKKTTESQGTRILARYSKELDC